MKTKAGNADQILNELCLQVPNVHQEYPALYLHKRNKHKEAATCTIETRKQPTEDGKMVMGSTLPGHDTQAEGPCPKKRRKRLDIDLTYTCSICGNSYGSKQLYIHTTKTSTHHET